MSATDPKQPLDVRGLLADSRPFFRNLTGGDPMRMMFLVLVLLPLSVIGDTWEYDPERTVTEYEFGDTKISRIVDATENQLYPDFVIDIHTAGQLVGKYQGIHFEHIFAISDNEVFVGISNSGLPGTAIVIFDNRGRLRFVRDHRYDSDLFTYCDQSSTLIREWFDESSPNVEVGDDDGKNALEIRGCDGSTVRLSDLVSSRLP